MVAVIKKCDTCGKTFTTDDRNTLRPNQKYWFCSKKCYNDGRKIYDFYKKQTEEAQKKAWKFLRDPNTKLQFIKKIEKGWEKNMKIRMKQRQIQRFGRKKIIK